jgi:hypothetical protein
LMRLSLPHEEDAGNQEKYAISPHRCDTKILHKVCISSILAVVRRVTSLDHVESVCSSETRSYNSM